MKMSKLVKRMFLLNLMLTFGCGRAIGVRESVLSSGDPQTSRDSMSKIARTMNGATFHLVSSDELTRLGVKNVKVFGEAWKDPAGVIWGEALKTEAGEVKLMTQRDAAKHCKNIGASLPTGWIVNSDRYADTPAVDSDLTRLRRYFKVRGSRSLYNLEIQILPDLYFEGGDDLFKWIPFWSGTVASGIRDQRTLFYFSGSARIYVESRARNEESSKASARCVLRTVVANPQPFIPRIENIRIVQIANKASRGNPKEKKEGVQKLVSLLADDDSDIRYSAASTLSDFFDYRHLAPAVPELKKLLSDSDIGVRVMAIRAIDRADCVDAKGAVPELLAALTKREPFVRREVVDTLESLGEIYRQVPRYIKGLSDNRRWVRLNAIAILSHTASYAARAIEPLKKLEANDPDSYVRSQAAEAIAKIKKTKPYNDRIYTCE